MGGTAPYNKGGPDPRGARKGPLDERKKEERKKEEKKRKKETKIKKERKERKEMEENKANG